MTGHRMEGDSDIPHHHDTLRLRNSILRLHGILHLRAILHPRRHRVVLAVAALHATRRLRAARAAAAAGVRMEVLVGVHMAVLVEGHTAADLLRTITKRSLPTRATGAVDS